MALDTFLLRRRGSSRDATLPCASHLGGSDKGGDYGFGRPPGVEGWPARPPTLSATARSVGEGNGLPAWPWAETFSLSSYSEQSVRERGCQLAQGPGYRAATRKVEHGFFSSKAET